MAISLDIFGALKGRRGKSPKKNSGGMLEKAAAEAEKRHQQKTEEPAKAIPTFEDSLNEVLENVDATRDAKSLLRFDAGEVLTKAHSLCELPTLTSVADSFKTLAMDPDADLAEVAKIIQRDPALTVQLLKILGSAHFGLSSEAGGSIEVAVHQLGSKRIRTLASVLASQERMKEWDHQYNWRSLWMHSFATALLAEEVRAAYRVKPMAELHSMALLHDVGKIILSYLYPVQYAALLAKAAESYEPLSVFEKKTFDLDHEEVGGIFAKVQKLPENLGLGIRYHSEPKQAGDVALPASIVQVANHLAKNNGLGFSGTRSGVGDALSTLEGFKILRKHNANGPAEDDLEVRIAEKLPKIREELMAVFPA